MLSDRSLPVSIGSRTNLSSCPKYSAMTGSSQKRDVDDAYMISPIADCPRILYSSPSADDVRQMIKQWTAPDGTFCEMSSATSDPPFEVVIHLRGGVLRRRTFRTHHEAAEFAIEEMRTAFSPLKDDELHP